MMEKPDSKSKMMDNLRQALGSTPASTSVQRPAVLPPRRPGAEQEEIDRLILEVQALSGHAQRIHPASLLPSLAALVHTEGVRKAVLWPTSFLKSLHMEAYLQDLGVEVVPPQAGKLALAGCDLGVTGVDFALPETGTLALLSGPDKPRTVSLLPRIHLALMLPDALRPDLHQVFEQARQANYLILITGPSRTADIELTVTLGVHGPKELYLWVLI